MNVSVDEFCCKRIADLLDLLEQLPIRDDKGLFGGDYIDGVIREMEKEAEKLYESIGVSLE